MSAQLSVELTADIRKLDKGLSEGAKALASFEQKAKATQAELERLAIKSNKLERSQELLERLYKEGKISLDRYNISTQSFRRSLSSLDATTKSSRTALAGYNASIRDLGGRTGGGSIGGLQKGVANATPTLQEFSRVIQDAPFGIQGVGNNITQLVGNFGSLSKAAGGAGAAFRLLVSSLIGPAGILFAVSAVVSLLTVYGDKLFKSTSAADKLKQKQEELNKSIENWVEGLNAVNRATLEGNKSAATQLVRLNLLRTTIENTALSIDKRREAVDALQKEFPQYFKNIEDEKILNNELKDAYEQATIAIQNRAKAIAAQELLVENARRELELTQRIDEIKAEIAKNEAEAQAILDKRAGQEKSVLTLAGQSQATLSETGAVLRNNNDLSEEQLKLQTELNRILEENSRLANFVTSTGGAGTTPETTTGGNKGSVKAVNAKQTTNPLDAIFAVDQSKLNTRAKFLEDFVKKRIQATSANIQKETNKTLEGLSQFGIEAGSIIFEGIANTIGGIGTAIGQAIAQGGNVLQAAGGALLAGFGTILSRLGDILIQAGIASETFQKLFINPLGGGLAAIGVGIALKAFAGAFSNVGRGGFGASSVAGQGTQTFSGSASSATTSAFDTGGTVVFEIQGTKLVGVLNRTLKKDRRTVADLI